MGWLDALRRRFERGREDETPARAETGVHKVLETPDELSQRGELPADNLDALADAPPDNRPDDARP